MPRKPRDPFEVKLTAEQTDDLVARLSFEITEGETARQQIVGPNQMLDQWHRTYEGGDRNISKNTPWPDAANLSSWIGTEKVDAFRARVVKTIFQEPVWIVSGWGVPQEQLALIEKFHQWKVEEERLQGYLSRVVHNALIEGTGVLEVSERPMLRRQRQRIRAMVQTREDGVPLGDESGQTMPMLDEAQQPIEAPDGTPPEQTTLLIVDKLAKVRTGPQYRVVPLRDFLILPGHAQDRKDVWGYAKRFWARTSDLRQYESLGVYRNIDELGDDDERWLTPEMQREGQGLATQQGPTAEKELWQITFLDDLDHDGIQEWYIATLHVTKRVLLRLQRDDLGQSRYLLFIPFPRTRFVYGYSLIGHKLETVIDEHTAWRNMIADRAKLVISAPMLRLVGSVWNPQAVPWAPNAVLPVRDMNEIKPLTIPDIPSSVVYREASILQASERVAGMVDTAAGTHPEVDRTLGEVKTVLTESLIRVDEVVKHLQETMEDLFQIRHEIWKRTLKEQPQVLPLDLMVSLEARGIVPQEQLVTAEMLDGPVRGKPRGSVDTADMGVMRQDFIQFITALTQFSQSVPTFGVLFQDPELGRELLSQAIRVFRWENPDAIMAALQRATQKAQAMMAQQQFMPPGAMPGSAPGVAAPRSPEARPNAMTRAAGAETAPRNPARAMRGQPPGGGGMMGPEGVP